MDSMSDLSGRLKIELARTRTAEGRVCRITSTRPVMASTLFVGRTPATTATLMSLLFAVCGKAQSYAAAMALEQATGMIITPEQWTRRRIIVAIETIREHLWRMLLDWPLALDEPADHASMAELLAQTKALYGALDPHGQLFQLGTTNPACDRDAVCQLLDDLDHWLAARVFGVSIARWLERVQDAADFAHWCATTATSAARLLHALSVSGEASVGQSTVAALPEMADAELIARCAAPDHADFIAHPTWGGCPRETSPFSRRADTALIQALIAQHGRGLLPRLAAPLLDVAMLHTEIRAERSEEGKAAPELVAVMPGVGVGRIAAARGLLIHLAGVAHGRVTNYRILAPTEWNFHPQGVVAQGLTTLENAEAATLRRRAELLIMATDPCVAYDLTLSP